MYIDTISSMQWVITFLEDDSTQKLYAKLDLKGLPVQ